METLIADVIREALDYLTRWQNKTLLIGFAPIGSISKGDMEVLVEDVRLLKSLGIDIQVAFSPGSKQFMSVFSGTGCNCFKVTTFVELANKAVELGAIKLCLLSGVDRITTNAHGVLDDLSIADAEEVIKEAGLSEDARTVLQLAVAACKQRVPRVHIINAHHQGTLLTELFTCGGAGVMVYSEAAVYKTVRGAERRDITAIMRLVYGMRQTPNAMLAYRSYITTSLGEFVVYAVDDEVHGCVRLSVSGEVLKILDLANGNNFKGRDILLSLLKYAIKRAGELHLKRVSVPVRNLPPLTAIQTWFSHLGFERHASRSEEAESWDKTIA